MASPSTQNTFNSIRTSIKKREFKPIYLLMGEESYYIDELVDLLSKTVLTEAEKDFNMLTFYGVDSDVNNIIASARRFPMMSEYQLIIVKEAQLLDKLELFDIYAKNPMPSTILVLTYMHGKIDSRKAVVKNISKVGLVFESKHLYDNQIPSFITQYLRDKGVSIDEKSSILLADHVGNDLSKLIQELKKLEVAVSSQKTKRITSELIELNVGISKDFNNFELTTAVAQKDVYQVNRIIDYFDRNPKDNPIMVTITVMFNYFSNLLECYWLPRKDEQSVMKTLNIGNAFFAKDYMVGLRNYNAMKVTEIISLLRTYDAKSKGIDNSSSTHGQLLKELMYKILH
ncbi:MAG: DNA polymerase III subunit delta [Dysgonamonadaceae bacterium]|nr:DNA polymerase III subunit delta [Dysgonamonadaceae bacterium]MDD3900490.1 DNA polymerase III subunit delta [Dysgonamonadaceae bacterium]MDD4398444.1 DNA polymerase III subunit delta [Dysgonamonadaceae bacterium]